jgi:thiazole/oxazole-forming peptide maturase SagD family component
MDCFATTYTDRPMGRRIETLMRRMVSPVTGLDKTVGFSLHDRGSAGLYVTVAQLTAIHRLVQLKKPLSYHLGGYGLRREEALIRVLGETTERYAHMACLLSQAVPRRFATAAEMRDEGFDVVDFEGWSFFVPEQYARPKFLFQPYRPELPILWLETWDLGEEKPLWAPAQLLVLGYLAQRHKKEPRLASAVTTGTAAHTDPEKALNAGILELLQMDAAMGFWYSGATAPQIELDGRLATLEQILRQVGGDSYEPCFHYVPVPDFDVHVVTCVLRSRQGELPCTGVGIACAMSLESACYKAFTEASAIPHLAQIGFLHAPAMLRGDDEIEPDSIDDLDLNVLYYAMPQNVQKLDRRFTRDQRVPASELPRLPRLDQPQLTKYLVDRFRHNRLTLCYLELTTPDVADLGFHVCRSYSPDLLSLSLPSFPQAGHPRFEAYGGFHVRDPHPFP